jgi:flagellar motor protein MotB
MDGFPHPGEGDGADDSPIWPAFGDLMACLFGLFVLLFIGAITIQVGLGEDLEKEKQAHAADGLRLQGLEQALAVPLAAGRITLSGDTIAIGGSVLFSLNSAELRPEGAALLRELAEPLRGYLATRPERIMVSGYTDDLPLGPAAGFRDNWELSTERALTVTRALSGSGVPRRVLFAAGFGENDPVVPNTTSESRARNRRVEISLMPRRPGEGT